MNSKSQDCRVWASRLCPAQEQLVEVAKKNWNTSYSPKSSCEIWSGTEIHLSKKEKHSFIFSNLVGKFFFQFSWIFFPNSIFFFFLTNHLKAPFELVVLLGHGQMMRKEREKWGIQGDVNTTSSWPWIMPCIQWSPGEVKFGNNPYMGHKLGTGTPAGRDYVMNWLGQGT